MTKTIHIITGATGFLGRHLVGRLLKDGERICIVVRSSDKNNVQARVDRIFPGYVKKYGSDFDVVYGDITKKKLGIAKDKIEELKKFNVKFWHLAANLSFRSEHKDQIYRDNVQGVVNVVDFVNMIGQSACLYYTSTAYVCGTKNKNCTEDDIERGQKPRNAYERTKIIAEKIIRKDCLRKYVIFRPSIIVGDAYEGKAVGCTFGYYRFTYVFYLFKKWVIRILRSKRGFWLVILKLLKATYDKDRDVVHFANLFLPYPKNSRVNLVPVNDVINAMIVISASNIDHKTFHLVNANPPSFIFLFQEILDDIGLCGVKLVPVSPSFFQGIVRTCYFLLVFLRKYFESAVKYQPYITVDYEFLITNTQQLGLSPIVMKREHVKRINQYAVHNIFPRIKIGD